MKYQKPLTNKELVEIKYDSSYTKKIKGDKDAMMSFKKRKI